MPRHFRQSLAMPPPRPPFLFWQGSPQPGSRGVGSRWHPPFRFAKAAPSHVPRRWDQHSTQHPVGRGYLLRAHSSHTTASLPPPPTPPPATARSGRAKGRSPSPSLPQRLGAPHTLLGEPTGRAPKWRGERAGGSLGGCRAPAGQGRAAKQRREPRVLRTGAVVTGNECQEKGTAWRCKKTGTAVGQTDLWEHGWGNECPTGNGKGTMQTPNTKAGPWQENLVFRRGGPAPSPAGCPAELGWSRVPTPTPR